MARPASWHGSGQARARSLGRERHIARIRSVAADRRSDGTLLFFAPVTTGGRSAARGRLEGDRVSASVFHYNPDLFWMPSQATRKRRLSRAEQPVGVVWISLNLSTMVSTDRQTRSHRAGQSPAACASQIGMRRVSRRQWPNAMVLVRPRRSRRLPSRCLPLGCGALTGWWLRGDPRSAGSATDAVLQATSPTPSSRTPRRHRSHDEPTDRRPSPTS